jgi:predicted protein tyrosine phosphatase
VNINSLQLKITSLQEAYLLSTTWATHIISLLNPELQDFYCSGYPHLTRLPGAHLDHQHARRYYFHDITDNLTLPRHAKLARLEQIQDILELTATLQATDKLLVHCHAGISRSTAVACGILCQQGLTPQAAVKWVFSMRPQAMPNLYILSLFDQALKLENNLVMAATKELNRIPRHQAVR